jgi:2'-5' RNA ligase
MNLAAHYDAMRTAAVRQLASGAAELDPLLDAPHDTRRGLTLLARPPAAITAAMEAVLADFRRVEPAQYYYPASDIHLTILSIISCYPCFTLATIDPTAYRAAGRTLARASRPFSIRYAGLTASAGGIMVQGFPQGVGLQQLRDATRILFQESGLKQSIDQRYRLQTAHSTVIRFRAPLADPAGLLALLKKYERHAFGSFEVTSLELVYNDWYQRAANTTLLEKYAL